MSIQGQGQSTYKGRENCRRDYGKVMYFDSASANISSFDLVANLYVITWDQTKRQFSFCDNSGRHFVFKRRGGLFVCDVSFLLESHSRLVDTLAESTVLVSSARKNEKMYSKRQVARAKLARTLLRSLAFGPPSAIARMLNQGAVIECPITSTDIVTADKIYGKLVPELRGKTVRHSGFDTITVEPGIRRAPMKLSMYTDIMFVNRNPFLLSIFAPINLTMVSDMGGSNALPNIRLCLETHLNLLEESGFFTVGKVHCENEFDEEEVRILIRARPEAKMVLAGQVKMFLK